MPIHLPGVTDFIVNVFAFAALRRRARVVDCFSWGSVSGFGQAILVSWGAKRKPAAHGNRF